MSEKNLAHFIRRIKENISNSPYVKIKETEKKKVDKDIYFYGIFHAISINLQNKNALPDEDLLDLIQKLFDNWYLPEMTEDA